MEFLPQDFVKIEGCLKGHRIRSRRSGVSRHSSDPEIWSFKPYLNIDLRSSASGILPLEVFILDSGSDLSLIHEKMFKRLIKLGCREHSSVTATIGTTRGDYEAQVFELEFRLPEISKIFVKFRIGLVSESSLKTDNPKNAESKFYSICKRFFYGNPNKANWAAIELFRKGKVGILAGGAFARNFDYVRTDLAFHVRVRPPQDAQIDVSAGIAKI